MLDLVSQGAITHFHMNLKFVIALPPVEFLQHMSTKRKILRFDNRHYLNFVIAILLLSLAPSNERESFSTRRKIKFKLNIHERFWKERLDTKIITLLCTFCPSLLRRYLTIWKVLNLWFSCLVLVFQLSRLLRQLPLKAVWLASLSSLQCWTLSQHYLTLCFQSVSPCKLVSSLQPVVSCSLRFL